MRQTHSSIDSLCFVQKAKARPVQYRERSDRMPHSILCCDSENSLLSVASGRFARGTVLSSSWLVGSCGFVDRLCFSGQKKTIHARHTNKTRNALMPQSTFEAKLKMIND